MMPGMDAVRALSSTPLGDEPVEWAVARLQVAAAIKVARVDREMGEAVVKLLDPTIGSRFDRRA